MNANFQLQAALNGPLNISLRPKCWDKDNFLNHIFSFMHDIDIYCIFYVNSLKKNCLNWRAILCPYMKLTVTFRVGQMWFIQWKSIVIIDKQHNSGKLTFPILVRRESWGLQRSRFQGLLARMTNDNIFKVPEKSIPEK